MTTARVGSVWAETLIQSLPPARVTSVWAETLIQSLPPARVTSVWVETLIGPGAGAGAAGWTVGMIRFG